MVRLDSRYLDHLTCPVDGSALHLDSDFLVSTEGRRYPIVDGVPVMLRDDVVQTMDLAWASLDAARKASDSQRADEVFIDTLGTSESQREALRQRSVENHGGIDPVVSMIVSATNGMAYREQVGRLERYPIPELRLPDGSGATFLDLGCNWGRWSIAAARKGYRVVGIDPSLGAVMAARRVARSMGLDILYVVGDARYLPFRDALFAQVFSYSVLQHMAKSDVELVLDEVGRVLAPGGASLIQMAAWSGIRSLMHLTRRRFRQPSRFEVRYWGPRELERTFARRIGPSRISVDCYFGLGLQYSDRGLMPPLPRTMAVLSEHLRRASERLTALRFVADSLYVSSRNLPTASTG
jgi:SAM-dependent methyltransferase